MILTIFLHGMDGLLLKYDMMISFSGKLSGLLIFPGFSPVFHDFSWFFGFTSNLHISKFLSYPFREFIDDMYRKYN